MNIAFYDNYWTTAKTLPDNQRLALFDSMFAYAFEGHEPEPSTSDPLVLACFGFLRANIDASIAAWESGKRGGRPSKKGGFNPPKNPPLNPPLNQHEHEHEHELKRGTTATGSRQTQCVCPDCGGVVTKNNASPNWSCHQCRSIFTPTQAMTLEVVK